MAFRVMERDKEIIDTVRKFHHMTAFQIERLFFSEQSGRGAMVVSRRRLRILAMNGKLRRLERFISTDSYVYLIPKNLARGANLHALDIAELYVQLSVAGREGRLTLDYFDPEPACYIWVNDIQLKPDATFSVNGQVYFLELDRATEAALPISDKVRRYAHAERYWDGTTFPKVFFAVPDEARKRQLERLVCKDEYANQLFQIATMDEAIDALAETVLAA